jgi:uncharacterized membrane protein YphA (DoxX/SURF4 family)
MKDYMPLFIRVAVAALLVSYGVEKLGDPVNFLKSIHEYDILSTRPPWLLNFGPNAIPLLEIAAGVCILTGFLRKGAALTMGCFLVAFTGAIVWRTFDVMEATGQSFGEISFDCGCGGGVVVIWEKIVLNGALIVSTFYCMLERGFGPRSVSSWSAPDGE